MLRGGWGRVVGRLNQGVPEGGSELSEGGSGMRPRAFSVDEFSRACSRAGLCVCMRLSCGGGSFSFFLFFLLGREECREEHPFSFVSFVLFHDVVQVRCVNVGLLREMSSRHMRGGAGRG